MHVIVVRVGLGYAIRLIHAKIDIKEGNHIQNIDGSELSGTSKIPEIKWVRFNPDNTRNYCY